MEQIENTTWTPIPGFDKYSISKDGKVSSKKKRPLKYTVCNTKNKYGVYLLVDGKSKVYPISFLMATTFIENPNKYTLIRYKDNNIENYDVNNLEWTDNPYMSTNTWDVLKNYPKKYYHLTQHQVVILVLT